MSWVVLDVSNKVQGNSVLKYSNETFQNKHTIETLINTGLNINYILVFLYLVGKTINAYYRLIV